MLDTTRELDLLNFYRASELHGGLILGQIARRVRDPQLVLALTRHAAEEVVHAQCWTETMIALGGESAPGARHLSSSVRARASRPCIALSRAGPHPGLRAARLPALHAALQASGDASRRFARRLRRLLDEEREHLSWVKTWLEEQEKVRGRELVVRTMREFAEADETIYAELCDEYGFARAA